MPSVVAGSGVLIPDTEASGDGGADSGRAAAAGYERRPPPGSRIGRLPPPAVEELGEERPRGEHQHDAEDQAADPDEDRRLDAE